MFAGLLINQLVDEGALDLQAPIGSLLEWLEGTGVADVSLRQLLTHSAGLVAGSDALVGDVAQAWLLRDLAMAPVGAQFHYSNTGYVLLGLAASAVTGVAYPVLIRDRLLLPMGMVGSTAAIVNADRPSFATGYQPVQDDWPWAPGDALTPAPWVEEAAAAGNVSAPAEDIDRLIRGYFSAPARWTGVASSRRTRCAGSSTRSGRAASRSSTRPGCPRSSPAGTGSASTSSASEATSASRTVAGWSATRPSSSSTGRPVSASRCSPTPAVTARPRSSSPGLASRC